MDGEVWALTSTNSFSEKQEIYAIKGYEITDYKIPYGEIEDFEKPYPFFVGHKGVSNLNIKLGYDETFLYLYARVNDLDVFDKDGVAFYFDTKNKSTNLPVSGIYSVKITFDEQMEIKEGNNGVWEQVDMSVPYKLISSFDKGYEVKLTLSWESLGGKPSGSDRVGFTVELFEATSEGHVNYSESLVNSKVSEPYTWGTIHL
jgi:hypothetical protein